MKKSILTLVLKIARDDKRHKDGENFLHFSFVIQSNKVIEWGKNNKRVPPRHNGYHHRIEDVRYSPKTHSEIDAWKKAKGLLDKRETFELVNIRLNRSGEIRNSKPCVCCYEILKELGCKRFYYSSEVGFLTCI